jgi:FkbM family methyltransferase
MLTEICKHGVRRLFGAVGLEVSRSSRNAAHTLLGLRALGIRTVLDIGANRGQFVTKAQSVFPDARFYCFEPLNGPFAELERLAHGPNSRIVRAFNLALGECEGTAPMFEHLDHNPSSSLLPSTAMIEDLYPQTRRQALAQVRMARLDDFVDEARLDLDPNILVKMDVQGYENRVIEGGTKVLRRARACVLEVTFDPLYQNQCTFKDVWKMLDALDYRFAGNVEQFHGADGHVIFADSLFLR